MPWNSSNPLYRWMQKKGKLNKSAKAKVVRRSKTQMVKRRIRRSSPRRWFKRFRRKSHKIPLEVAIIGVSVPFVSPGGSYPSPMQAVQSGDYQGLARVLCQGFTGFDPQSPQDFSLFKALNPFDFDSARYTKMLLYAGLVSKVRKRFVKLPMEKIPLLGRYIS